MPHNLFAAVDDAGVRPGQLVRSCVTALKTRPNTQRTDKGSETNTRVPKWQRATPAPNESSASTRSACTDKNRTQREITHKAPAACDESDFHAQTRRYQETGHGGQTMAL